MTPDGKRRPAGETLGYDDIVAANGSDVYDEVDIEGAKALLAEAGVTLGEVGHTNGISVGQFGQTIGGRAGSPRGNWTSASGPPHAPRR